MIPNDNENKFTSDSTERVRTVSKGVNYKTGEGMRLGPWSSFEEWETYADKLVAEDYDNELEI